MEAKRSGRRLFISCGEENKDHKVSLKFQSFGLPLVSLALTNEKTEKVGFHEVFYNA